MRNVLRFAVVIVLLWFTGIYWLYHSVLLQQQQQQQQHFEKDSWRQPPPGNNNSNNDNNKKVMEAETFNGIPLTFHQGIPKSSFYCIDGSSWPKSPATGWWTTNFNNPPVNHSDNSWMFRSCQFQNLCFHVQRREYSLFLRHDQEYPIQNNDNNQQFSWNDSMSSNDDVSVALGGINPRWDVTNNKGGGPQSWRVKWFPRLDYNNHNMMDGYYQLPSHYIWIPFHSLAGHNVGHLIWDDFYPIFSLLTMFHWLHHHHHRHNSTAPLPLLLLLRQVLAQGPLYASCDIRKNKRQQCQWNFVKFLQLLGTHVFSSSQSFSFTGHRSTWVCASRAVAGMGMLTDHGFSDHGWKISTSTTTTSTIPHNLGRGPQFFAFREFLLHNILKTLPPPSPPSSWKKITITFNLLSSRDKNRRLDFAQEMDYLRQHLDASLFHVQGVKLWEMDLVDQVKLAQSSHIFITACGGGAVTATFLPRGASLIVYYVPTGGVDFETLQSTLTPARLDWDLLNNAGFLKVHWLPILSKTNDNNRQDLELLLQLILHEVQIYLGNPTNF